MLTRIKLQTPPKETLIDITAQVREAVRASGVQEGLCALVIPHTTAAITINSCLDAATAADILGDILLGGSQSVVFCEFDGPRNREVLVRIMADA
ncbi:MAG: YjbQ family protein [Chloroflexi bacterium]|nr:YjbQ family protein [Chloroflexota bacterium]